MKMEELYVGQKVKCNTMECGDYFPGEATVFSVGNERVDVNRKDGVSGGGYTMPDGRFSWIVSGTWFKYLVPTNNWKGKSKVEKTSVEK